ncbi:MAG: tyrosine-type recombinase/integrase [Acholeplasmatales bacterium]|nr:tyrosine-type recombinase/integrase [Acholeplasmatales bacterium]
MNYKDMPYYKEKSGKLRIKKSYKGYIISYLVTSNLEDAYEVYKRKIEAIDKILLEEMKGNYKDRRRLSLDNLFILYLDELEFEIKESSISKKESTFRCHLKDYKKIRCYEWNNNLLKKINLELKRKYHMNSNIHYRTAILLRDILKYAKKYEYVSGLLNLDLIDIPKRHYERSSRVENCYLTYEQFNEIVSSSNYLNKKDYEHIIFYIQFLYYTGMRINEARAIKRSDIKVERTNGNVYLNYILVERQMVDAKATILERLKSDNPKRKVYIKSEVKCIIDSFCDKYNIIGDDYIFDYMKCGVPLIRQKLSYEMKDMIKNLKENKLIGNDICDTLSPHGLRYSNTEYLIKIIGVDLQTAAKIQGHSVQVMLDIYTRINKNDLSIAFGKKY